MIQKDKGFPGDKRHAFIAVCKHCFRCDYAKGFLMSGASIICLKTPNDYTDSGYIDCIIDTTLYKQRGKDLLHAKEKLLKNCPVSKGEKLFMKVFK